MDFKGIRQIHILEPWYNINRIEQVIGRGVRNLGHKNLNFEHHNVQIFMHAAILDSYIKKSTKKSTKKNNLITETADLYLYRYSEMKAIKMGKITRLLKEVSVDCLINHEQTNFTVKKMLTNRNNNNITQILSNREEIKNFKVGDKPNTSACDFMDTCEFSCNKKLSSNDDLGTNITSNYNELFISTNTDKLMLKIKNLMKIKHFYKKRELIFYINSTNKYSLEQINYTLTQMIENNEQIVDKYDRIGKLINIGDYYLFQPDELKNNYISSYDRSTVISRKPYSIQIPSTDLFKDKTDNIVKKSGVDVLDYILTEFNKIIKSVLPNNKTEYTWYNYAFITMNYLKEIYDINLDIIQELLIEHICDKLSNSNIVALLNDIFTNTTIKDDTVVCKISKDIDDKKYPFINTVQTLIYQKMVITNDKSIVFGMPKHIGPRLTDPDPKNVLEIYIFNENKWNNAGSADIVKYIDTVSKQYRKFSNKKIITVGDKKISSNKYVGFMSFDTTGVNIIFYVWIKDDPKNLGFRCEQHQNVSLREIADAIESEIHLIVPNTPDKRKSDSEIHKNVNKFIRCWRIELLLRYCRKFNDSDMWFIDPESGILGFGEENK